MKGDRPLPVQEMLEGILSLQRKLRDHIHRQLLRQSGYGLAMVAFEAPSDTIYTIDRQCEEVLLPELESLSKKVSFVLIAEGISDDRPIPFPEGRDPSDCQYRIILDPIDGTRMLMYDKRSAWSLAGVAVNRGESTSLEDICMAAMTEIPVSKQTIGDVVWACQGEGCHGWRENLLDGSRHAWNPSPSRAENLDHGFAQVTKFFPGRKALVCKLEEDLLAHLGAFDKENRCLVFDDQYLSTGGQIYEILAGHDRFQADLRASMRALDDPESAPPGMACHPYDICTALLAREAGIIVTDIHNQPLNAPLDTTTELDWIAYANPALQARMAPVLSELLLRYGLSRRTIQ